jgi:hypothetical protein
MLVKINKIPDTIFNEIKKVIKDKKIKANKDLAGNLKEEFILDKYIYILEDYLLKNIFNNEFLVEFMQKNYKCNTEERPIRLTDLWVNYMKKHEFNPLHDHSGVFSFILFIKIPFTMEKQKKLSPGKNSKEDLAGCLQFVYFSPFGKISFNNLYVDKSWEQSMLIFPASLHHCVYPFYGTNEYRITVSGNASFKV